MQSACELAHRANKATPAPKHLLMLRVNILAELISDTVSTILVQHLLPEVRRAFSGSVPTIAPALVKCIIRSTAGSCRGHTIRPPPFGSPVFPNVTQYPLASPPWPHRPAFVRAHQRGRKIEGVGDLEAM